MKEERITRATVLQAPLFSPSELESQKTKQQRAEDIAYTINHAISCGVTDLFIQPYAGAWLQTAAEKGTLPSWLHWTTKIVESHDDHDHGHEHEHAGGFWHNAKHWFVGEAAGDLGAVPLTILMQRQFPGLMHGIRLMLEPVMGGMFKGGANRAAASWALRHGLNADAPEAKAKAEQIYEHEMSHLPQALMWNVFSFPINIAAQRLSGSKASLGTMIAGKTFGAVVSNTMLIGGRAVVPEAAHKWDRWSSKNLIIPSANAVGGLLGIDKATMEKAASTDDDGAATWQTRTQTSEHPDARLR